MVNVPPVTLKVPPTGEPVKVMAAELVQKVVEPPKPPIVATGALVTVKVTLVENVQAPCVPLYVITCVPTPACKGLKTPFTIPLPLHVPTPAGEPVRLIGEELRQKVVEV